MIANSVPSSQVEERVTSQESFAISKANNDSLYARMLAELRDYAVIFLDPNGVITSWNKGAEAIKGYQATEAIGKKFEIFYTQADRESGLPNQLLKLAKAQGSVSHEGWRVRKNGTHFWCSVVITAMYNNDELIGFTKVTRDLTEKKIAEDNLRKYTDELEARNEELRLSEERYYRMIAEVQDYAIILLDREGNIEDWNAGAEFIKGYQAEEIIGKNFRIFYTDKDRDEKLPEMLIDLAARRGRAHHEGWRVRKDGTRFWGSITITALHNSANEIIGFTKVTRDLTEKKIAEDELKKKNSELEEANKELNAMNKELSSFAYISSHDLQEPLRKIQTFTTRIIEIDEKNLSEKGLYYFSRIENAAHRMRLLIDDLLSFSRANTGEKTFEVADINEILKEVLGDVENHIEEKKAVVESGTLPTMNVIPFQFHQLLYNLVMNALKFSRKQSNPYILIRSRTISADKVPGLQVKFASTYYSISVSDNGIGFSPEYNERIFEVFQRLHGRDEYPGTGIGLAICKKIVENHHGIIKAEGRPGDGATFNIYIPTTL